MKIHYRIRQKAEDYGTYLDKTKCGLELNSSTLLYSTSQVWRKVNCNKCLKQKLKKKQEKEHVR